MSEQTKPWKPNHFVREMVESRVRLAEFLIRDQGPDEEMQQVVNKSKQWLRDHPREVKK